MQKDPEKLKEYNESLQGCISGTKCDKKDQARLLRALVQYNFGKELKANMLENKSRELRMGSMYQPVNGDESKLEQTKVLVARFDKKDRRERDFYRTPGSTSSLKNTFKSMVLKFAVQATIGGAGQALGLQTSAGAASAWNTLSGNNWSGASNLASLWNGYGNTMGPPVDISEDECRRIVQIYRQKNWKIKAFWKKMDQVITNMTLGIESKEGPLEVGKGFIRLPNGMFLQYFGLHGTAEITRDDLVMTETTYLTR
jgi:hypothetical protein